MGSLWYFHECYKRMLLFWVDLDSDLARHREMGYGLFLQTFSDWLMSFLFSKSQVRVPSSSGPPSSPPPETCSWPATLSKAMMPPPGQSSTGTSGKERTHMLIEREFVMWIKETKGLCSARTSVYCSSWQLGNLLPSASHHLPTSQPF